MLAFYVMGPLETNVTTLHRKFTTSLEKSGPHETNSLEMSLISQKNVTSLEMAFIFRINSLNLCVYGKINNCHRELNAFSAVLWV